MPAYGLATILEDCPVGHEFAADNIPLHLTHVDAFQIDLDLDALVIKLTGLLSRQPPIDIVASDVALYGHDKGILVTNIELTPELARLQAAIVGMVTAEGAVFKRPQHLNGGFRPHVSIVNNKMIAAGTTLSISEISVAANVSDDEKSNRKILATIKFNN